MSTIGKAIREIRLAAEISLEQLASQAEIDTTLIRRLEEGNEEGVSTADVARIAKVLRVDEVDLMTGKATSAESPAVFFR